MNTVKTQLTQIIVLLQTTLSSTSVVFYWISQPVSLFFEAEKLKNGALEYFTWSILQFRSRMFKKIGHKQI